MTSWPGSPLPLGQTTVTSYPAAVSALALEPDATVEGHRQVLDDDEDPRSCTPVARRVTPPTRCPRSPAAVRSRRRGGRAGRGSTPGGAVAQLVDDGAVRRRHDRHLSIPRSASRGVAYEQPAQVRQPALDVAEVGAHEPLGVDDRVVDPDVEALADQPLRQLDVRALPQVVGVHFEAQARAWRRCGTGWRSAGPPRRVMTSSFVRECRRAGGRPARSPGPCRAARAGPWEGRSRRRRSRASGRPGRC